MHFGSAISILFGAKKLDEYNNNTNIIILNLFNVGANIPMCNINTEANLGQQLPVVNNITMYKIKIKNKFHKITSRTKRPEL